MSCHAPSVALFVGHLLPVSTVVTVVGRGLRSAPTGEMPDEEDTEDRKLQGAEEARHSFRTDPSGSGLAGVCPLETLAFELS